MIYQIYKIYLKKINKLKNLWNDGSMDYDLIGYLPGMA